jgi:hypothetical protein
VQVSQAAGADAGGERDGQTAGSERDAHTAAVSGALSLCAEVSAAVLEHVASVAQLANQVLLN